MSMILTVRCNVADVDRARTPVPMHVKTDWVPEPVGMCLEMRISPSRIRTPVRRACSIVGIRPCPFGC
jgi:hypothetical protein